VNDEFERDQALDVLLEDALTEAEGEMPRPRPAFADIVARAHSIDEKAVPSEAVRQAVVRAASGPLHGAAGTPAGLDAFEAFIADARAEAMFDIADRGQREVPPMPASRSTRRLPRITAVTASLLAVAAAVLIAVVGWGYRSSARRVESELTPSQASAEVGARDRESASAIDRRPETPKRRDPPAAAVPVAPAEETIPDEPVPLEPASAPSKPEPKRVRAPLKQRLERLDEQAERALARGDAKAADRLYAKIIAQGRRNPRVELAYAERFTIAHRLGNRSKQRKLYRAYLRTFPRGRFVDDARAGLCRTVASSKRPACWSEYLKSSPDGAYAAEARRGASSGGGP
jgi:hypothetical protein